MSRVMEMNHPLILHKLSHLRRAETGAKDFRELLKELSTLMAYEVTRDMPLEEEEIQTPLEKTTVPFLQGRYPAIIPILRAGLGMVDGIRELMPNSRVGHIGLYRDPDSLEPVEYYCKLPDHIDERELILVDPMLATGGSVCAAITYLKRNGGKRIKFMCLIAAPEGIAHVQEHHPDVDIYVAAVDRQLNEKAYILPGLGDAGDRIFGTR